jgi:hypothetical protein
VVLILVLPPQVLEVQDFEPELVLVLVEQTLVFRPLVWLAIFRTASVSPLSLPVELLASLR